MKKTLALIVALVLLASACLLVGCGDDADNDETGEIVIRILENDTAKSTGYLKFLLDSFNQKYADQNVRAIDANMDQYADLENDGPYGHGPDVLYQANDIIMKYVQGKHVYPIDRTAFDWAGTAPETAWETYSTVVDNKTLYCGVPVNVQQPLLFYRKDILPQDWQTNWDDNNDGIPDMVQFWNKMYAYSKVVVSDNYSKIGYGASLINEYFNSGFLYSYGGYCFGDNNKDDTDIGFSAGNAVLGAKIIWDLADIMDKRCLDDSFTVARESMMADGTLFATITTPDSYTTFLEKLTAQYVGLGFELQEAKDKARENIVVTDLPLLPVNGDITSDQDINDATLWKKNIVMGGINGYAISSYSKHKDWCQVFIQFATSPQMIEKRIEALGMVPVRGDLVDKADQINSISQKVYDNLNEGIINIMPSITSIDQVWSPLTTAFKKIATDGCDKRQYTLVNLQTILEECDQDIYKAIHTLS